MSVTDPLIKDIKACTLKFLEKVKESESVTDSNPDLYIFCQAIEKIFVFGLLPQTKPLGFTKQIEAWCWLEKVGKTQNPVINYGYSSSVEKVQNNPTVNTNCGRLRLLIRHCLAQKCIHVPIQYLIISQKISIFYKPNSIIGDEILSEILLSVLLQCSKIRFELDLRNSSFLDYSWHLPEILRLELVPCENLGLSVSFANEKAVIVNIKSNSVISENDNVEVGDILDNLNGVHICSSTKGRLSSIFLLNKGRPVTITIIKALNVTTKNIYPPILKFLKDVDIDPVMVKKKYLDKEASKCDVKCINKNPSAGFKVTYLGSVEVGKYGDVKQIDKSFKILQSQCSVGDAVFKRAQQSVFFEIGEIGVKIVDEETSEVVFKHSYMEISSCGTPKYVDRYFAYIVGDGYCNEATSFTCHVFHCSNPDTVYTILQSLGQGFHRTHFAV